MDGDGFAAGGITPLSAFSDADPGTGSSVQPLLPAAPVTPQASPVAAPASPPPDPSNPFAVAIRQVDDETAVAAQQAVYANKGVDPDKAAKAAQLGQQFGVPGTVVEGDLPNFQQRAQAIQNISILRQDPALASWVAANPLAARVASDDFSNLSTVGQIASEWKSGWSGAVTGNELARQEYAASPVGMAFGNTANPQMIADLEASMQADANNPAAHGFIHGVASFVGGLADNAAKAAPMAAAGLVTGAAIGAAATGLPTGSVAAPVGAVPGAMIGANAGFTIGMFRDLFKVGFGNGYKALGDIKDADGNAIDPTVRLGAAAVGAIVNGVLGTVGLKFGTKPLMDAASSVLGDGLKQAVARPTVATALSNFATNVAKGGMTGALLGGVTEGSNVLAEEAAKQLSAGNFQTVFNDPATRQQAVDRIASAAGEMALGLGIMHGVGGLPPLLGDMARAGQASSDMGTFQRLQDAAVSSNLRGRAPGAFEDWMNRQTNGTPVENLFIPADRVAELYQTLGAQPGPGDHLFGDFMPDIAQQIEQGRSIGGDVVVPTSGYLTHLAGTDISQRLQPDIRVRQDGMSLNDATTFHEAYAQAIEAQNAQLQQQFSIEAVRTSSTDQIANDVRTQASAAGFSSDAAEKYAQLYAARYGTRGERLGEDPLDLYRSEGVTIQREDAAGLPNTPPDSLDLLINSVRSGKSGPSDESLLGPSLLKYLAGRGGVEDIGGDLTAMGADAWHKGKPGTRRLVRASREDPGAAIPGLGGITADNEFTPDASTRAAWEAGYFPEHAERPDVNALHEAMRDELGGKPRYSEQGLSRAQEFRDAADDLDRTLQQIGIDPAKATNAEIKRALAAHGEDGGAVEYGQSAAPFTGAISDPASPAYAEMKGRVNQSLALYQRNIERAVEYEKKRDAGSIRSAELRRDAAADNLDLIQRMAGKLTPEDRADLEKLIGATPGGDRVSLENPIGSAHAIEDGSHLRWNLFQDEAKPPVALIRGDEIAPAETALPDLRQAAREFYDRELRGKSVHSDALDRDVQFRSAKKTFSASANPDKLRLFAALREIIAKGELKNTAAPRDPAAESGTKAYHYIEAPVDLGGKRVNVGVTVREDNSGALYYNHAALDERVAPSADPQGAALKAGPSDSESGATHSQNLVVPDDGINLDVRDGGGQDAAQPGAGGVGEAGAAPDASGRPAPPEPVRRGSIRLGDQQAVISLFAKRDLSTLLHETGHLWLDELIRDAGRDDAPQQLRDDLASVTKWLGVDSADQIGTEQHEQFARGVEAYLMEGKAPSTALRAAFGRFKAWLTKIYRTVGALNAPIDPTIRGVFDRLIASDDQIERVRDAQGLRPLFRSADEAGMTDAEYRAYTASVERVRGEAADGLTAKVMADVRRQRTAAWRDEDAPMRDDVTREVDARPDMKALRLLRTGKLDGVEGPGQRIRLDRQAIVDSYGSEAALSMLPRRVPPIYSDTGGMHPDMVAEMLGMRSGNDLLSSLMTHEAQRQALIARGEKRSVRQFAIDDQTYARMVERHGDALQDGSIESDALDQIHSARQAEVLGAELKALGRRTGQTATPTEIARRWAERTISDKLVKDGTKPGVYLRAEGKAGNAATRAVIAGDHAEAFRQKNIQLLNHSLYLAAKAARDDVDRGAKVFARFGAKAEFPTIAPDFSNRVHDLLRRFSLPLKRNLAELDRALGKTTLEGWATQKIADGHEIYIAPELYDGTYAKPVGQLTVAQFRDLADTVRSIAHVGRDQQQVLVDGVKADRAEIVQQMVAQLGDMKQRDPRDFENQGGRTGIKGAMDSVGDGVGRFHAMLLKPEAIIDRADGDDPNGVFNKAIFRRIKEAQATENELQAEMVQRFRDIHDAVGKDYGEDFDRSLPPQPELTDQRTGQPMPLKKRGLIGIALNVGNESNLQRLMDGYGWSADGVKAALDRNMTAEDWRYVQGAWDAFESLFPRIEAMQRRMTGVGLDKVEAREVETPFGTQRGGYYPVVYDPNLSLLGDRIKASGDQRFEADYVRATTAKGHTVARLDNVAEPLSLNPDIIHWKIGQAVHDLAYREAIVQADSLLRDQRVMGALDGALGRDTRKQLDTWLQGVANSRNIDTRGLAAMDSMFHRFRTNAMVVGIGFRATTMLKHGLTALSNSMGELGPKWLLHGSTEFFGSWDKMQRNYAMITGKSAEMKYRMDSIDRDVRDALQDIQGKSGLVPAAVRFSHYGVASLDMLSALPTWLGAYRKAESGGMEEADAVAFADKTVRNAHGANGAPDLAAIQRGGEAQKLFTMFYGFFNHIYNRQVVGVRAARSGFDNVVQGNFGDARTDFAKAVSTFFFYLAVPAIIEGLVSQGGPGDQDSWLGWAGKQILGEIPAGVPVLRDVAKAYLGGREYEMSPIAHALQTGVDTAHDATAAVGMAGADKSGNPKQVSDRWLQHAIETAGYVSGLPTGQAAGTAQFLHNVAVGTENPQDISDWLRGVIYGPAPKHKSAS